MTMTKARIKSLIERAKARITDPEHWCHGVFAQDANGQAVDLSDDQAVRWCATASVKLELSQARDIYENDKALNAINQAINDAACDYGYGNLIAANDNGGHGAVLDIFDKATTYVDIVFRN